MDKVCPDGYYLAKNFKLSWAPHDDLVLAYEITTKTLMINTATPEAADFVSLGGRLLGNRGGLGVIDYPLIYAICNGAIRK